MARPRKMQLLSLLPGMVVKVRGPGRGKVLYLTFDDGPSREHTPALLDLLKRHDVRASFFLIGTQVERHPDVVERMVAEGHTLGNHSYSHPLFHTLSLGQKLAEISRTDQLLERFDGRRHHGFRPPRGVFSWLMLGYFVRHRRQLTYWTYDSLDYSGGTPSELAARLRRQPPRPGEILLMHDDSACSLHMLETLIPEWRAAGFTFMALPY